MSLLVVNPMAHVGPQAVQKHLGERLRMLYEQLPVPPAPDQFSELLRRLDRAASARAQA